MRRALVIVAVVAGCSLLETALLLIYLLPTGELIVSSRNAGLGFAQFVTIPSTAAVFSLLMYGRHQWIQRTIIYIATVPGFLAAIMMIVSPVLLLGWAMEEQGVDPWGAAPNLVFSVLLSIVTIGCGVAVFVAVVILLFFMAKIGREHGVGLESSRWLAERHRNPDPGERKWRERGLRWSLWIPSLMVLTVILFLPEMWGLLSHLQNPRSIVLPGDGVRLPGYEVTIPPTWVTTYRGADPSTEELWVFGIAGRGMAFGATRYLHGDIPLSTWEVQMRREEERDTYHRRWVLRRYNPSIQHNLEIGGATLTCQEYVPTDIKTARMNWAPPVHIECSNAAGLYLSLEGDEVHVPTFYKMVAGITPALPDVK